MTWINAGHPDDGATTEKEAAAAWLKAGGRGIDTAYDYMNQDQVGEAVYESGINRQDIFVTTKISPVLCTEENAYDAVTRDLKLLNMSYVDLVLHHFPCKMGGEKGNLAVWSGLERALSENLTRAIGVSNYVASDLKPIVDAGGAIALNQCQMSVGSHDDDTISFCKEHNITYEAYSPLRHVNLTDSLLVDIASKHGKSTSQIALRWIVQQDVLIATSPGANVAFIDEDLDLGSFQLSEDEMSRLSGMA